MTCDIKYLFICLFAPVGFTDELYQISRVEMIQILYNLFQKIEAKGIFLNLWDQHFPHTKGTQEHHKKAMLQTSISHEHKCKNPQKSWIQPCIKRIIWRFISGIQDIQKSINSIYNINRLNKKNHVTVISKCRKASDRFPHPLMLQALRKLNFWCPAEFMKGILISISSFFISIILFWSFLWVTSSHSLPICACCSFHIRALHILIRVTLNFQADNSNISTTLESDFDAGLSLKTVFCLLAWLIIFLWKARYDVRNIRNRGK